MLGLARIDLRADLDRPEMESNLEGVFSAAEERAEGAPDQANEQDHHNDQGTSDDAGGVGMVGGEPGEGDGDDIFAEGEANVGEGLRGGGYGGANCGFAAVSGESDGGAEQSREKLLLRSECRRGAPGEERGDRNTDEGMEGVPDEVEGRDFVGKELDGEEGDAGSNDPPIRDRMERVRQDKDVRMGQQA